MATRRFVEMGLVLLVLSGGPAAAQPAGERVRDIARYIAAMKTVLAEEGIEVKRIDSPPRELLVVYSVADPATGAEFALGAVLCLAQPLARDVQFIRVRSMANGRKLVELTVSPDQLKSSLTSIVTEAELAEIEALRARVFEQCGLAELDVPVAVDTSTPPRPATLIRQGDAPVGEEMAPVEPTTPLATSVGDATAAGAEAAPAPAPVMPSDAEAQELAAGVFGLLSAASLENLSVGRDGAGQWVIEFENRTWRDDIAAVAMAMEQIASVLPPGRIMLRLKRHDVVVSHVWIDLADYVKLQAGLASPESLAERWEVRPGPGSLVAPVTMLAQGNESYARTDLMLRPLLEYEIGREDDPFVSDLYLVPTALTTWAEGLWTEFRAPARVTGDQSVSLDRALMVYTGRPVANLLATASAGRFDRYTYGYYGEVQWDNEHHRVGAVGTLTSAEPDYNPFDTDSRGFLYYEYDWGELGLDSRIGWGKFQRTDESGLVLTLRRRFGESLIEARAVRSEGGDEGLHFELTTPLGPRRSSRPELVRLRTDPRVSVDYTSDFTQMGDYLQGSHDLQSFRGQLDAAYLQHHGNLPVSGADLVAEEGWPAVPSLEGTSGLMRIPTADVAPEGTLLAGISYMDRSHSKVRSAVTDAMPTFIGAGFLPNLELVGRLTFFHDVKAFNWPYSLDRSFNVHYRACGQRGWLPAVAIGAQDVSYGTTTSYLGKAEYIVGTWERADWRLHLGAGSGRFDPVFAGVEYAVAGEHEIHLMTEYDSDFVNAGVRFIGDWGSVDVGLLGMSRLTGAVTFETTLH